MPPLPAASPQSTVPRVRCQPSDVAQAWSPCKSLLICPSPYRFDLAGGRIDAPAGQGA